MLRVYQNEQQDVIHICYTAALDAVIGSLTSGSFEAKLFYKADSSSTFVDVSATEVPTFVGEVTSGRYHFKFTPVNAGQYELHIKNLDASATALIQVYPYRVETAGSIFSASYTDAFCSESDIETYWGLSITATSRPNATLAAGYARLRASEIRAKLAGQDILVTPDSGTAPVDTTDNNGYVFRDMLRMANALGAAMDCADYAFTQVAPNRSEKAKDLEDQYKVALAAMLEMAKTLKGKNILGASTYSEGDAVQYEEPSDAEGRQPFSPYDGDW